LYPDTAEIEQLSCLEMNDRTGVLGNDPNNILNG